MLTSTHKAFCKENMCMIRKKLPIEITSYDLVKTFAIIIMIIDHIGLYLFPDAIEWRMVGRLCVPVWLFLIGYARSRDISPSLWMGAFVLVGADVIVGWPILSLNILFTIIIIRLVLDYVVAWFEKSDAMRFAVGLGIILLLIPTLAVDYGTSALALAMYGYYVRRYQEGFCSLYFMRGVMVFAFMVFVLGQQISFGFTSLQFALTAGGLLFVTIAMQYFTARDFPALGMKIGTVGTGFLKLCGRYSLEIFVMHLLVFKFAALFLGHEGLGWFDLKFIPV
jgi:hypothetical protein